MKIKVYLKELQYRLFFTCLCILLNTITIYRSKDLLVFLLGQHQNNNFPHFIATNLPEVFLSLIKLSFFFGLYFGFPIILIQAWFFICSALYKYEYKIIRRVVVGITLLYVFATFSVYKIFLPYCWKFFSTFELNFEDSGVNLQLETRLQEYLDFLVGIMYTLNVFLIFCLFLGFFLFKFPLFRLIKFRKIMYFSGFILATLITPPDIASQIFIGTILVFVYEIFMFSIFLLHEYKKGE